MPALRELQRRFGAALREAFPDGDTSEIESLVRGAGIDPARRLNIYRNNSIENFRATLAAAYPVLERLVGTGYFRQMAREYQDRYPSRSGNLQHLGAALATFLERRVARTEFAYFIDVARLEWAYQEILVAAEHAPFAIERLGTVGEDAWASLGFVLHPAVRLVRSEFPILSIWSAHQDSACDSAVARIDLASGGENVLLRRAERDVEMHRLPAPDFAFLESLASDATLADATDRATALEETFDLTRALKRYVGLTVLVDFTVQSGELS